MDSVFESVFSGIGAFVYRCRNDKDYTMEYMAGGVALLLGYQPEDIIGNKHTSYVGLTVKEDEVGVFEEVDRAIEAQAPWDVAYRVVHKKGHHVWLRERGTAIYEDGKLSYLQGLVVGAEAEFALREKMETQIVDNRVAASDIVALTNQISGSVRQLSMLSINARIEAARSGEVGKGFAVVADEMKVLSQRNAEVANKIAEQVKHFHN